MWSRLVLAWLLILSGIVVPMKAEAPQAPDVTRGFAQIVQPFLKTYCVSCHGAKPAAQLDLSQYPTVDSVVHDFPRWNRVLARVSAGEMPPKQATQPSRGSCSRDGSAMPNTTTRSAI